MGDPQMFLGDQSKICVSKKSLRVSNEKLRVYDDELGVSSEKLGSWGVYDERGSPIVLQLWWFLPVIICITKFLFWPFKIFLIIRVSDSKQKYEIVKIKTV